MESRASLPPSNNPGPNPVVLQRKHTFPPNSLKTADNLHPHGGADFELSDDFKVIRYTSLKDLLPSSPRRPSPIAHECDIQIRNRLVKKAAYAYLQTAAAERSSHRHHCEGFWGHLLSTIHDSFDWVFRARKLGRHR